MEQMVLPGSRVYHHIIQVCSSICLVDAEDDMHQLLERHRSSMQTEGENPVMPVTEHGAEGGLLPGQWHQRGLPVPLGHVLH